MKNTAAQLCGGIFAVKAVNKKAPQSPKTSRCLPLELLSRFELETSSLPRMRSTN